MAARFRRFATGREGGGSGGRLARRGGLEGVAAWPVGPGPVYGRHRASTRRRGSVAGRPPHSED
jgi:hypothetical protein